MFLASFTQHYVCEYQQFNLTAILHSIIQIYHNLFTHSTVDGHSGFFQFGDISNSADINVLLSFGTDIYVYMLGIYLRVALLSHEKCLCSGLIGTAK